MIKTYNIPDFLKYLNIGGSKDNCIAIINYGDHQNIKLKSDLVAIDFFMLAIKAGIKGEVNYGQTDLDESSSFLYMDQPKSDLQWNVAKPFSGYAFLIDSRLFNKYALGTNFPNYDSHEALFLTTDEETLLRDIFGKAYSEYCRENFSTDILVSYARLIFSYANVFYERQFETRSSLYNQIVADFYRNLETYYDEKGNHIELPNVAYFATKSNHSPNYFGDVIKHFTGNSPLEIIHEHIIKIGKEKLRDSSLSVSQVGYSLGFEYPTYFTRFFKNKTGVTPNNFRNQ